jgi:uncharacterized protein (DUF2141 family)
MRLLFSLVLLAALHPQPVPASETGTIEIRVNGLRSADGGVAAALFDAGDPRAFPTRGEQARASQYQSILPDQDVVFRFEALPHGAYAVAFFHDENGNRKLDTNFLGIPREGMAASNDAAGRFGPPRFEDAAVILDQPLLRLEVLMRY